MKKYTGRLSLPNEDITLAYTVCEPECEVRAIVQVSHGMCEYIGRYETYAEYLAKSGILLAGNDHPGHGDSAESDDDLGYFAKENGVELAVEGLHRMTLMLAEKYPDTPIILLGHSMGSFLARIYITQYGGDLAGAIIMGTGGPDSPTGLGIALANIIALFRSDRHRSKLLRSIASSGYLARCGKNADKSDWLTRDREIVKKYNADKYCSYTFTVSGYRDLFRMLAAVSTAEWAQNVPTDLPLLIISGGDDPVGGFGKGVRYVYDNLKKNGADVTLKLYPEARHELFNETNRDEVFRDLIAWLEGAVK